MPFVRVQILVLLLAGALAPARAQTLDLVGTVAFPVTSNERGGTDVWAYTAPGGAEYALMGVRDGIAVVAVPSLDVVAVVPGPTENCSYYHRDIKTRGAYAFAVSECYGQREGLTVIDLTALPDTATAVTTLAGPLVSSHNLSVDRATGYAYVMTSDGVDLQVVDVRQPEAPALVGTVPTGTLHDVYARNDTLWVARASASAFALWDVSDKAAPVPLTEWVTPSGGYAHNIWPTDDGRYAVTTEETADRTVKVWDLADPADPTLVGEYLAPSRLAHNAHIGGRYVFVSHYESGLAVLDLANPSDPVEVDRFDTYPQGEAPEFHGNWGTVPVTPGGYVYASDIEGDLNVFRFTGSGTAAEPDEAARPFALEAIAPNPTRNAVTVRFTLSAPGPLRLAVFDARGRELARLFDGAAAAGAHTVPFDGTGLAPGVYLLRLEGGGQVATRRFTLLR